MVHTVPGSLIISPTPVTDMSRIKFSFKAALDFQDYAFVAGFHAKYYVLKRNSTLTIWDQLTVLDCNNCVNMSAIAPSDLSIEYDHIPAGTYDFMVIEQGDYTGTGKNDPSRYATITGVTVEHAVAADESTVIITANPSGSSVMVGGESKYSGGDSYEISGKIGTYTVVTVSKTGYIPQSISVPFADTTTRITISLDACFPGAAGCETIKKDDVTKTCVGMNRNNAFDPMCILEPANSMYLYGAIGLILLVLFMLKRGGGGGSSGRRISDPRQEI